MCEVIDVDVVRVVAEVQRVFDWVYYVFYVVLVGFIECDCFNCGCVYRGICDEVDDCEQEFLELVVVGVDDVDFWIGEDLFIDMLKRQCFLDWSTVCRDLVVNLGMQIVVFVVEWEGYFYV